MFVLLRATSYGAIVEMSVMIMDHGSSQRSAQFILVKKLEAGLGINPVGILKRIPT